MNSWFGHKVLIVRYTTHTILLLRVYKHFSKMSEPYSEQGGRLAPLYFTQNKELADTQTKTNVSSDKTYFSHQQLTHDLAIQVQSFFCTSSLHTFDDSQKYKKDRKREYAEDVLSANELFYSSTPRLFETSYSVYRPSLSWKNKLLDTLFLKV